MMNDLQLEDKAKLIDTLARARKDGNTKLIEWCEKQLKRYHYEIVK